MKKIDRILVFELIFFFAAGIQAFASIKVLVGGPFWNFKLRDIAQKTVLAPGFPCAAR